MRVGPAHFDGEMEEFFVLAQPVPIRVYGLGAVSDDTDDGGVIAGTELPDAQVADERVPVAFARPSDIRSMRGLTILILPGA
jgi:hypothetical protein